MSAPHPPIPADPYELAAAIERGFASYAIAEAMPSTPEQDAELEASCDRVDVMIDAATALPVTAPGAREAKMIAFFAVMYGEAITLNVERSELDTAGRLAYDLRTLIVASAGPGAPTHPDAALLALAPTLLPLIALHERVGGERQRLYEIAHSRARPRPDPARGTEEWVAWQQSVAACQRRVGYEAITRRHFAIEERIVALTRPLLGVPARTLEGVALKMRLAAVDGVFEDEAKADLLAVAIGPPV